MVVDTVKSCFNQKITISTFVHLQNCRTRDRSRFKKKYPAQMFGIPTRWALTGYEWSCKL